MLTIILATILILTMTAFLLSQGLFSSMIMAVLSMLCAAFALNAYPALASEYLYARQGPIADGVVILALFVMPLIIFRFLADFLVPKNVEFSVWIDRIGGGVFGLLASMTMVGMVMVIMQTLPFGSAIFGYQPYDNALQRSQRAWPFCPDDFAVSLGSLGSVGAFGGQGSFNDLHADFLREAACSRNTAGAHGTTFALPKSLRIRSSYLPLPENIPSYDKIPADPLMVEGAMSKTLLVGTEVGSDAGDADDWIRLAGTQFRLVTRKTEGKQGDIDNKVTLTGDPIDHYPVGYILAAGEPLEWKLKSAAVDNGTAQVGKLLLNVPRNKTQTIYWVYRIAQDEMPDYMVFRRVSSKKVSKPKIEMPKLPTPKPEAAPKDKPKAKAKTKSSAKKK